MKIVYTLIFSAILLSSCGEGEKTDNTDTADSKTEVNTQEPEKMTNEQKISTRWILVNRRNENGDKMRDFEKEPISIVTYFEDNGYFRVYDSISNADNNEGVQNIEQRKSGQWEIDENGILVLRYTKPDTVIIEHFEIQSLDKNELIIKSKEKDQISTYERKY